MASTPHSEQPVSRFKRPPRAWVVRDLPPQEIDAPIDWERWYLTEEDDMGESPDQNDIITLLLDVLRELARERRWKNVRVAGDSFFGWVPGHPLVQVSPDVYVMDKPPAGSRPKSFQTWKPGIHPPRFAVEVVSTDRKKDLKDAPERYAQLGCKELVIFDPAASQKGRIKRHLVQVFRRDEEGAFVQSYAGSGPAYCAELDAWLVPTEREDGLRMLRLARDAAGRDLVASGSERADAAEARIAELEAQLKRRK